MNHPEYEKLQKLIEEYTNGHCLNNAQVDPVVNTILNLGPDEIAELSDEECIAKSLQLMTFAMYIQKEYNENVAILEWCEHAINAVVAESYNNYEKFMKHEIRVASAIKDNSFAQEVDKLYQVVKTKTTLLKQKGEDVRNFSRLLEQISRKKSFK